MKKRVCVTLDADHLEFVSAQGHQLSTLLNLLLSAYRDPSIEYRKVTEFDLILQKIISEPDSPDGSPFHLLKEQQ